MLSTGESERGNGDRMARRPSVQPFSVVAADCPWRFSDKLPGKSRGAEKNYAVLSVDELCTFPLPPIADDALLFFWRVSSMVEEAYRVIRAWGFVPKSELVWVKTMHPLRFHALAGDLMPKLHFGMGRYTRASHETCVIATRGRGKDLIADRGVRSVFFAPTGAHSEKPDEFFSLVERLVPTGPRLELFARRRRPGWTCMGLEVDGTAKR